MNNIIKSIKSLQEAIAMASPSIATNMEIVRRLQKIVDKIEELEYQAKQ